MSTNENILEMAQGQDLVRLARKTLEEKLGYQRPVPAVDEVSGPAVTPAVASPAVFDIRRGVFVTLNIQGRLRGCIGSLTGEESIRDGVRHHAVNAAFNDPRFSPVTLAELDQIHIEVSVLTDPQPLTYQDSTDLITRLRPHVDGVILRQGGASATYLPQVWDQLPDVAAFLSSLCVKAGLAADTWRRAHPDVETYQVQSFEEP